RRHGNYAGRDGSAGVRHRRASGTDFVAQALLPVQDLQSLWRVVATTRAYKSAQARVPVLLIRVSCAKVCEKAAQCLHEIFARRGAPVPAWRDRGAARLAQQMGLRHLDPSVACEFLPTLPAAPEIPRRVPNLGG